MQSVTTHNTPSPKTTAQRGKWARTMRRAVMNAPAMLIEIETRESAAWAADDRAGCLDSQVRWCNSNSVHSTELNLFVDALYSFDVEALRALIDAGANVTQLYSCNQQMIDMDPVAHVLFAYTMRARIYGGELAARAWACRAAQCAVLLLDSGASPYADTWVGLECEPVIELINRAGLSVYGWGA